MLEAPCERTYRNALTAESPVHKYGLVAMSYDPNKEYWMLVQSDESKSRELASCLLGTREVSGGEKDDVGILLGPRGSLKCTHSSLTI